MRHAPTLNAEQVADMLGWKVNTVYRNRLRSISKLSRGMRLSVSDFPTGNDVNVGRLMWRIDEIEKYRQNRKRPTGARGARPDSEQQQ